MDSKKIGLLPWSLLLATACVETLELGETDGSHTSAASAETDAQQSGSGLPTDTSSGADSMPGGSDTDGGEDWILELSQLRCAALFECDCPDQEFFGDLPSCVEMQVAWLVERQAAAVASFAVQRSQSCYEALLGRADADRCDDLLPPASILAEAEAAYCPLFVGTASDGEACTEPDSPFQDDSECAEGLVCRWNECVRLPTEGEACLDSDFGRCASPWVCLDGVCAPRLGLGEACEFPWLCEEQLWCVEGSCAPVGGTGERCEEPWECASQLCTDGQCEAPRSAVCGPYVYEEQ